ncbi:MAG: thermonuclease family protein [Candidatus Izemoplasmatales bacterium]|nr:thermonuclease family protein [Candidatus Izemoplasmatales bacterium]
MFKKTVGIFFLFLLSFTLIGCKPEEIPTEINTNYTDALKLEEDYENKSFLDYGIGEVTLTQVVDGDTAHFIDKNNRRITVRFLAINTPESTGRIEAWGKAASEFVKNILAEAKENGSIVLESEEIGKKAELDSTGGRYLAYVWYKLSPEADFRLLNLEIVEECYSKFTSDISSSKHGLVFNQAHLKSYEVQKRVYGEQDPNFDYSNTILEVTIAEIKNNFEAYDGGSRLKLEAQVMRLSGDNIYLQDVEQTFNEETKEYEKAGIYMFSGYGSGLGKLNVGAVITLQCQTVNNEIYGKQLTNPQNVRVVEHRDGFNVDVNLVPSNVTSLAEYEGYVVEIKNVKFISKSTPDDDGVYTIYGEMENKTKVNLRVDKTVYPKPDFSSIEVGAVYDVIGGVSKFHDGFQLMLANSKGYAVNDLVKK